MEQAGKLTREHLPVIKRPVFIAGIQPFNLK
jgi:hypothetical protein